MWEATLNFVWQNHENALPQRLWKVQDRNRKTVCILVAEHCPRRMKPWAQSPELEQKTEGENLFPETTRGQRLPAHATLGGCSSSKPQESEESPEKRGSQLHSQQPTALHPPISSVGPPGKSTRFYASGLATQSSVPLYITSCGRQRQHGLARANVDHKHVSQEDPGTTPFRSSRGSQGTQVCPLLLHLPS